MRTYIDRGRVLSFNGQDIPKGGKNADFLEAMAMVAEGTAEIVDPPPSPVPVPQVVSRFQARAALLQAGLLDTATAAIGASGNVFAQLAWAEAAEWRRDSPTLLALAEGIGLTSEQIDDLFRTAAEITA